MFARANSPEEHTPWAIISRRAPVHPQGELDIMPPVTSPMWLTEEYAIRDFRSVWRKQINLVMQAPTREILIIKGAILEFIFRKLEDSRSIPYPPNFRRIPARIIDPATGASTCALGSHKWVRNRGVLTKNARIVISHHSDTKLGEALSRDQNGRVKSR